MTNKLDQISASLFSCASLVFFSVTRSSASNRVISADHRVSTQVVIATSALRIRFMIRFLELMVRKGTDCASASLSSTNGSSVTPISSSSTRDSRQCWRDVFNCLQCLRSELERSDVLLKTNFYVSNISLFSWVKKIYLRQSQQKCEKNKFTNVPHAMNSCWL